MTISADRPLLLDVHTEERAVVISAHGSADVLDVPDLQERLARLASHPNRIIILDLSDLDFIGPDGLDALLNVRQVVLKKHGQIRLVNPNREIRRMLQVSRLMEIFPVYDSVEQALA